MNNEEIKVKISVLQDRIEDALAYLSSQGCQHCEDIKSKVNLYQQELDLLKQSLTE